MTEQVQPGLEEIVDMNKLLGDMMHADGKTSTSRGQIAGQHLDGGRQLLVVSLHSDACTTYDWGKGAGSGGESRVAPFLVRAHKLAIRDHIRALANFNS
jgi:hypothetical protein